MKKIILAIPLITSMIGCVAVEEKPTLIGPGHTFRDLRQHTFAESKNVRYFHPSVSYDGKLMAFVKKEGGISNIYIKPVNSRAMTQKTFHKSADAYPVFSPDGKHLAFASKRNGNWDIFVMNTDKGRAKRQVTSSPEAEIAPSWSKDGTKIVFCRFSRSNGNWEIWISNLSNGSLTNLVPGKFPTFSPTGNLIAFQRPMDKIGTEAKKWYAIWTIDDLGYKETLIISSEEEGFINPQWSPDADRIVFASGGKWDKVSAVTKSGDIYKSNEVIVGRKANDIWTVKQDGTNLTQLTGHKAQDWNPVWSSRGRIFFTSERDNYQNIWSAIPEFVDIN